MVTPSTCNYDITKAVQTDTVDLDLFRLEFRFKEEVADNEANEAFESCDNAKNEEIEKRFKYEETYDILSSGTHFSTPVCHCQRLDSRFTRYELSDLDISRRGDMCFSECQVPKEQTPVL